MIKKYFFLIVGLFIAPVCARAAVVINEVAWMGTTESQYGEWVELYNDGSSDVSVSGWKLYEAGGGTVIFTLTKSIPAGGYLVIERTTASAPDPLPGVNGESGSFGGSGLSNTGEYLVLKNDTGSIIDSLDASSGWPAGDATTKETMQKSGNSWVTATGTPNGHNSGASQTAPSSASTTKTNTDEEEVEIPDPVLYATIAGPTTLAANIVGAFIPKVGFTDGTLLAVGKFFWNFGDGETLTQETSDPVHHTYTRAGKYMVVLEYSESRSREVPDITAKFIVTVPTIPIVFSVTNSLISLKNIGSSEVDISNFILQSQKNTFTIPHGTILLAGADIVFPVAVLGGTGESVSLLYPNSTLFAVSGSVSPRVIHSTQKSAALTKEAAALSSNVLLANVVSAQEAETDTESPTGGYSKMIFAIVGLILLVITASILFLRLRKNKVTSSGEVTVNDIKIIESEE